MAVLVTFSFLGASPQKEAASGPYARFIVYGGTFLFELIIVLVIWFGIRSRGVSMRELIGGRWASVESFLLDIALAIGFILVANLILIPLRMALGTLDLHHANKQLEETKRMLGHLIPRSKIEAAFFVVLSAAAGLFEEIIFRGYLQRQFGALAHSAYVGYLQRLFEPLARNAYVGYLQRLFRPLARSAYVGIIASGIVFGLSHAYQGIRMMVVIAVYGSLFGIMTHLRRSLRPGMIAHAGQDALSGIALYLLSR
ncbi:MAG TPA: CPBP family intramembrane glutamic endopeptidase [Candidatus Angelobacter sp.]|nr:CPBP family intramembrane glutamic endopeptidase [Candidatus Angelobacter sp.]